VPRGRCLDLAIAPTTPCPQLVPNGLWETLAWYERLALWLLAEKARGADSAIVGYVSYLPPPHAFDDAPLSWTEEELSELRYPPFAAAVREQAASLALLHAELQSRGGPDAASVSLDDLRWAVQLVLSRAFSSEIASVAEAAAAARAAGGKRAAPANPIAQAAADVRENALKALRSPFEALGVGGGDGGGGTLSMAMMPMMDALNHRSDARAVCAFDPTDNAFVLTAGGAVEPGQQVFISYGPKGNDELLQLFGFVELANEYDTFLAVGLEPFALSRASELFSEAETSRRASLLAGLRLDAAFDDCELKATGAPRSTWFALRVLLGSASELDGDLQRLARPASAETEGRLCDVLRAYCKAARAAMGGSRTQDLEAVRRERSPRRRLALQYRSEKKRLLSELENRLKLAEERAKKGGKAPTAALTLE